MHELGGSLFIHNAIKYDFCVREALESLLALCDEVVALDVQSTDGTLDLLHEIAREHPKLRVYDHGIWECAPNYTRLAVLANQAGGLLGSEWHFMIQADEVLHEDSLKFIRTAIRETPETKVETFCCRRITLYKDFDHYVRFDSQRKPCNDAPVRLGRKHAKALGDAESLEHLGKVSMQYVPRINLFHYGLVRKQDLFIDKIIDMQTWFGAGVDHRVLKMKEETGKFQPEMIISDSELGVLKWTHPKFATQWVEERRNYLRDLL